MKLINISKSSTSRFIFKKIQKDYLISNISFNIEIGSINVIIGPNGAGKTTLSKIIANLDKDYSGKINSDFKSIGYLPQFIQPNENLPMDVNSLINLVNSKTGLTENNAKLEIVKSLIPDLKNIQILHLSGGNFKKLLLFLILVQGYDLIVLDEPDQNLDLKSESKLYEIIIQLTKQFGVSFVIVSHAVHTVMKYADKVIYLDKRICCEGKPSEVSANSEFLAFYSHLHD